MDSDHDPQIGEAAVLIERLARLMRASEHESGLNPAQWEVLRYLARCNRFSNTPTALATYLAATKGTISQTLKALEHKGLIKKGRRDGGRRSVALALCDRAWDYLERDPWWRLANHEGALSGQTRQGLRIGLRHFVLCEIAHRKMGAFGICASCRHFERNGASDSDGDGGPHHCARFGATLADADAERICHAHA